MKMISYQQMGCTINILQSSTDVQLDTVRHHDDDEQQQPFF